MANENKIYALSQYEYSHAEGTHTRVQFDVYCYNGTLTTDRATGDSFTLIAKVINGTARIDVAPFARSFLKKQIKWDTDFATSAGNLACWVSVDRTSFTPGGSTGSTTAMSNTYAVLGWRETINESKNNDVSQAILASLNGTIHPNNDFNTQIPIDVIKHDISTLQAEVVSPSGSVTATSPSSITVTDPTESTDIIQYHSFVKTSGSSVFNRYRHTNPDHSINLDWRPDEQSPSDQKLYCIFLNRYGAFQQYTFFGENGYSHNINREIAKVGGFQTNANTWDNQFHQEIILNVTGETYILVNTGFISENNVRYLDELLNSHLVYLYNYLGSQAYYFPVIPTDSSLSRRTHRRDGMINYEVRFKLAKDRFIKF